MLSIAGIKVRLEDFVEEVGDRCVVRTSILSQYLTDWNNQEKNQDIVARRNKQSQVTEVLVRVDKFFLQFFGLSIPSRMALISTAGSDTVHTNNGRNTEKCRTGNMAMSVKSISPDISGVLSAPQST